MATSITVKGLKELRVNLQRLQRWPQIAARVVDRHLDAIVVTLKTPISAGGFTPRDTGFMISEIRKVGVEITNDLVKGTVKSDAEYSSFVDRGTSLQKAQPFLQPAVKKHIGGLVLDLTNSFEDLFK